MRIEPRVKEGPAVTSVHFYEWLLPIASCLSLIALVSRYLTLLFGLIITLSKAAQRDRPDIFREFAQALQDRLPRKSSISGRR